MEIKCYDDDILIIECNRFKYSKRFQNLKGKWIDINGKNHFAVGKKYESELTRIVDDINKEKETEKEHEKESKYNNTESLKLKEEYYKSFNCKPIDFSSELKVGSKKSIGSLSSSSYGSSSSDGFPSPETPGKKASDDDDDDDDDDELDLEYIIDKLHELEKRIMKLEKRS